MNGFRQSQEIVKALYWETRINANPETKQNYKLAKSENATLILN